MRRSMKKLHKELKKCEREEQLESQLQRKTGLFNHTYQHSNDSGESRLPSSALQDLHQELKTSEALLNKAKDAAAAAADGSKSKSTLPRNKQI